MSYPWLNYISQASDESYPDSEEVIEATDVPEVETEIIYIEATEDDPRIGKLTFDSLDNHHLE